MQNDRLLPCPFCDKKLKKFKGGYEHKSSQCVLSSFILTDVEIPKWNTRKPMERIVERLEKYKRANDMCRENAASAKRHENVRYFENLIFATEQAISMVKEEGGIE